MRICHIIESASGGSAAILAALALHGVRKGHSVHVVYSPDRADESLIAALRDGGCASVQATPMRRSVGPHDARDGMRLRRLLRSLGPLALPGSQRRTATRVQGSAPGGRFGGRSPPLGRRSRQIG